MSGRLFRRTVLSRRACLIYRTYQRVRLAYNAQYLLAFMLAASRPLHAHDHRAALSISDTNVSKNYGIVEQREYYIRHQYPVYSTHANAPGSTSQHFWVQLGQIGAHRS